MKKVLLAPFYAITGALMVVIVLAIPVSLLFGLIYIINNLALCASIAAGLGAIVFVVTTYKLGKEFWES
jgi:hypothetical protein